MPTANVVDEAVLQLSRDLANYANDTVRLDDARRSDQRASEARIEAVIKHRKGDLARAERALEEAIRANEVATDAARRANASYSPSLVDVDMCISRIREAELRLDEAKAVKQTIAVTYGDIEQSIRSFRSGTEAVVANAIAFLEVKHGILQGYLAGQAGFIGQRAGGAQSISSTMQTPSSRESSQGPTHVGATATLPMNTVPGLPDGFALVQIEAINTSENPVTGRSDFKKGFSPEDLAWAHEALLDVVLPSLAAGKGIEYLRERDQAEGRIGTRSYADTYSGFFGDASIKLEWTGGSFNVTNGRHRIWVAQEIGVDTIVAKVRV